MQAKLVLAIAACAAAFALPATEQEPASREELRRLDLPDAPGLELISSISEYKPGEELGRQLHHGTESGYVVQGAMIQLPGKEPSILPTGAPLLNLRDVAHGGFRILGDKSLILFTVHVVDKGKPLYDVAK